jgi:DNA-binding PadR family transcriptional regulator
VTRVAQQGQPESRGLFDVFIYLRVLHAASKQPVTAPQLIESLARRGYKVNSRAILAILRRFERRGWLRANGIQNGNVLLFQATRSGKKALERTKPLVSALFEEISSKLPRQPSRGA